MSQGLYVLCVQLLSVDKTRFCQGQFGQQIKAVESKKYELRSGHLAVAINREQD